MEKSFYTGKGIGVCILDTGIYEHIDFTGRIWAFYDFLAFKRRPNDAAVIPLPSPDTTPPVTKIYLLAIDPIPISQ